MTEITNSLLDVNLDDAQPLKVLPDNTEIELRITRADQVPNKSDPSRNNLALVFDCPEDEMVDDIRVWIPVPNETQKLDDPKSYTRSLNRLAEFCKAFSLEPPFETDDIVGETGTCIVSIQAAQDGRDQNSIRRYVARR